MEEKQNLKDRILAANNIYMGPIIGENTELANRLNAGLEIVLDNEFGLSTTESNETDIDNSDFGPVLRDEKRYTRNQVLEMQTADFVRLHDQHFLSKYVSPGNQNSQMTIFFNALACDNPGGYGNESPLLKVETLQEAVQLSKFDVLRYRGISDRRFNIVSNYLNETYGLAFETKLG